MNNLIDSATSYLNTVTGFENAESAITNEQDTKVFKKAITSLALPLALIGLYNNTQIIDTPAFYPVNESAIYGSLMENNGGLKKVTFDSSDSLENDPKIQMKNYLKWIKQI